MRLDELWAKKGQISWSFLSVLGYVGTDRSAMITWDGLPQPLNSSTADLEETQRAQAEQAGFVGN